MTNAGFAQWSIKQSFLTYLSGLADSSQSVSAGAERLDIGAYRFPLIHGSDYDAGSGLGVLRFGGDVRLGAHGGAMLVMIAAPWVVFCASAAGVAASLSAYTVIDVSPPRRVDIADRGTVDVREDGTLLRVSGLVLTEAGRELFGGVYPPGTEVDAMYIRLGAHPV